MTDLQIFKNDEFGQVRTVIMDGQPWFVGKDVAEILGYANPQKAIRDHVDIEDKGVNEMDTPGGKQGIVVVNESGLYALVFGSQLESAKRFKRWVTSDVLPAIRRTGTYISPQNQTLDILQGMLDQMKQQAADIGEARQRSQKAIETSQAIKDTIIGVYDDWRAEIKHLVSCIQSGSNMTYQDTYNRLYDDLEKRARCDLSIRVRNGRDRLTDSGATKTKIEAFGRMDVIEADARLKEIFTTIIKEYAIKYVA